MLEKFDNFHRRVAGVPLTYRTKMESFMAFVTSSLIVVLILMLLDGTLSAMSNFYETWPVNALVAVGLLFLLVPVLGMVFHSVAALFTGRAIEE